jgi:hypothetical protein
VRHLFLVHSSITYLVTRQIIAVEQLPAAACAYGLLRNFQPDPDDPVAARALPDVPLPLTWRIWQPRQRIAALDREVAALTGGDEFTLYCPHTDLPMARLLLTHPRCRALHYVEEGTASYLKPSQLRGHSAGSLKAGLRQLLAGGRAPELPYYLPERFGKAYGISPHSFPELPRGVVLPLPFRSMVLTPAPGRNAVVLVPDALVEFGFVEPELMLRVMHRLLDELLARGFREVLYKLHPVQAQRSESRTFYEQDVFGPYRDRLTVRELPGTTSLEDFAFSYPDVAFAIVGSSSGLYAALCGRKVFTIAPYLGQQSERAAAVLGRLPPVFFELMEAVPTPDAPATPPVSAAKV